MIALLENQEKFEDKFTVDLNHKIEDEDDPEGDFFTYDGIQQLLPVKYLTAKCSGHYMEPGSLSSC